MPIKQSMVQASPGLITHHSVKNKQYPKSITTASNVLSNHKFDVARSTDKNKNSNNQSKCKQEQEKINLFFAQKEGKCFCCGKQYFETL
jgi:hypothetical protein